MSLCGKLANPKRFILSYPVYSFIIQSLHLPFLAKKMSFSRGKKKKKKWVCLGWERREGSSRRRVAKWKVFMSSSSIPVALSGPAPCSEVTWESQPLVYLNAIIFGIILIVFFCHIYRRFFFLTQELWLKSHREIHVHVRSQKVAEVFSIRLWFMLYFAVSFCSTFFKKTVIIFQNISHLLSVKTDKPEFW